LVRTALPPSVATKTLRLPGVVPAMSAQCAPGVPPHVVDTLLAGRDHVVPPSVLRQMPPRLGDAPSLSPVAITRLGSPVAKSTSYIRVSGSSSTWLHVRAPSVLRQRPPSSDAPSTIWGLTGLMESDSMRPPYL